MGLEKDPAVRIADALEALVELTTKGFAQLTRIANVLNPPSPEIVGTPYVAKRLGTTTVWVAEMARAGKIPPDCIVQGTGTGKVWKFYREKIEKWIASR